MTIAFLDTNVLAKPVTRTLLMVGGMPSGFQAVESRCRTRSGRPHAPTSDPTEARPGALWLPPRTQSGDRPERFAGTKGADRQILADAAAAQASFLITEDVDDYALDDLTSVDISAVNPDLFLAERLTQDAYATVIDLFVERQVNPPTTPAGFHAAIARQHPRVFAAHADLYDTEPAPSPRPKPAVIFRGARCLRCETIVTDPATLIEGLCPTCR
ncbi:MAG: hypothetical protein QM582_00355 [Micropruina sp.]|uniref:hypothetical protein n=1 Tax=Micropruina sp. TaxID=2737536 RepID=UPI0039E28731